MIRKLKINQSCKKNRDFLTFLDCKDRKPVVYLSELTGFSKKSSLSMVKLCSASNIQFKLMKIN